MGGSMRGITQLFLGLFIIALVSPGHAADTVEIAAIYALTGEAAEANAPSVQGVRIGVDEINEHGGILGMKVDLKMLDNQSTPIGSHLAAQRAADSGAVAIIGAAWSSHSLPMAEVAQIRGIPMISSFSTHPQVTKTGNYVFRVCFTDDFQGAALARFAREDLKAATASIFVNLTSEYSIGLSQIFQKHFEQLGGKVVYVAEYKSKQKDFDQQIQGARKAQADLLFLSGHDESGLLAKQAQEKGVQSIAIGGDGWAEPSFMAKGGDQLKRAYYCSHWSEAIDSKPSRHFVARYKDLPNFGAGMALAYDAVMVLGEAIRRAGSPERSKIRNALAETHNFEGVTGLISFDGQGDPVKSVVIMEIREGKPVYLKTLNP